MIVPPEELISEEMLTWLGFTPKEAYGDIYWHAPGCDQWSISESNKAWQLYFKSPAGEVFGTARVIHYLRQLQDIYSALTGKELPATRQAFCPRCWPSDN